MTSAPADEDDERFEMTVDMSVLESLGINLYSNAAAVLSELVANSWDADANEIHIDWRNGNDTVVVTDDGSGMTVRQLNRRFLKVGYQKRVEEGTASPVFDRPFMGRKGIGKLSVFSIAQEVTVYSSTGGPAVGLKIDVDILRTDISENRPHYPERVPVPIEYEKKGTTLVLEQLKGKRADITSAALRKRLARRFDVLDQRTADEGGFAIFVNGTRVNYADRQELRKLEFIWEFGTKSLPDEVLPTDIGRFVLPNDVVDVGNDWRVKGWIGTAKRPTDLTEDTDAGSLKNIIVLARKRPIQEGIIEKLDFSRIFGNYVTGQIEADFLDLDDGYEDIATSDRQRLIEDDERVTKLQGFLRAAFVKASEQWAEARPSRQSTNTLTKYPKLQEWVDGRPAWQRPAAEKMIGTIAGLELEGRAEKKDRATLFRSGILAFERLGLRQTTEDLENLTSMQAVDLLPLLASQESYESALWVDILRSRLEAISKLRLITRGDEKERILQEHLFHNLWLLDPSWERATLSPRMEENLKEIAPGTFAVDEAGKEIFGRIDIRYATLGGRHVIVELKRYSVKPDILELVDQGTKYVTALLSVLDQTQEQNRDIEVIFVLGGPPRTKNKALTPQPVYIADQLRSINGRIVHYDALIENAKNQYSDYLEASDKARKLDELLDTLENDPPSS